MLASFAIGFALPANDPTHPSQINN